MEADHHHQEAFDFHDRRADHRRADHDARDRPAVSLDDGYSDIPPDFDPYNDVRPSRVHIDDDVTTYAVVGPLARIHHFNDRWPSTRTVYPNPRYL